MRKEEFSIGQLTVDNIMGGGAITNIIVGQGKKLYVDSVHGSDGNTGLDPAHAKATIFGSSGAHTFCTASHGDYIICLPGHVESIIAAAGGAFSKIGVTVIFLGSGTNRAYVSFGTGAVVLSDINFTAAGVTLINPLFVSAIDALTGPLHITAADVTIKNAEYRDAAGLAVTHALVASSDAARLKIDGWKYVVSTTGTQKHSNIQLAGGDHFELRNIEIEGNFNVAPIESTAALTNLILENIYANNTNTGPLPGLNIHANTTGFAKNVKSRVASGTTYVTSVGQLQWADDCEGFSTDGYSGEPIGTAIATSIEGKLDTIISDIIDVWSDVKSVISDLTGDVWSDLKSVISDLADIRSDTEEITSDVKGIVSDLLNIKSDTEEIQSDVKSIISDLADIISDLTETNSDVKGIVSDLGDIISDLTETNSDVKSIISDLTDINSDLVIVQSDLKIVDRNKEYIITLDLAAAAMTGTVALWTIANGPILVKHMGLIVTTDIPAGVNTFGFTFTATGLADANLCGVTETALANDMQLFVVDGVKATGIIKVADPGIMVRANETGMPIVLSSGVIYYVFSAGPPATGAVTLYMQYQKLNPAATVT